MTALHTFATQPAGVQHRVRLLPWWRGVFSMVATVAVLMGAAPAPAASALPSYLTLPSLRKAPTI